MKKIMSMMGKNQIHLNVRKIIFKSGEFHIQAMLLQVIYKIYYNKGLSTVNEAFFGTDYRHAVSIFSCLPTDYKQFEHITEKISNWATCDRFIQTVWRGLWIGLLSLLEQVRPAAMANVERLGTEDGFVHIETSVWEWLQKENDRRRREGDRHWTFWVEGFLCEHGLLYMQLRSAIRAGW